MLGLLLVACRWPFWFYPTGLNPDESLMVAGAQTLVVDPVSWRSDEGPGPYHSPAWDWTWLSSLQIR